MAVTIVITGTKTVDFQKTQINKKSIVMAIDVTTTYVEGVDFQISYKSTNRSTKKRDELLAHL
jgi:hypothetical protein